MARARPRSVSLATPAGVRMMFFGLNVAMNQVAGVGVNQGLANLDGNVEGLGFAEYFALSHRRRLHDVVHRLPLDVFHHEVVVAFGGDAHVDGLNDVVVRKAGGGFAFLVKAIDKFGVFAELSRQNLDGHDAVQRQLPGFEYRGHRPLAQLGDQRVPGNLRAAAALFHQDLANALGLVGGDKAVFDEQVAQAALIGVGRLLLLFAAEFKLGLGYQPVVDDKASHLRIEVAG